MHLVFSVLIINTAFSLGHRNLKLLHILKPRFWHKTLPRPTTPLSNDILTLKKVEDFLRAVIFLLIFEEILTRRKQWFPLSESMY